MNIELINICKIFQNELVLENINGSFEIHSIAVIGPSGGGKSTLLRIIGGLLAPDSGTLKIDGGKIEFNKKDLQKYRRNIGFVFQSKGLFEHLNAMENMLLPLVHAYHISKSEAIDISNRLFERFGLLDEKNKYPFQLSGGQQQRIAIARAVAIKPKLLLLDEPTSALDPEYTAEVLNMLGELQAEGLKTIIVTHEMGFAKNACEKVIFLADKRIVESGESAEIFKNPQSTELKIFLNKILEWKV
ncbi:amino acid ABC transporter ATP-binding protein [Acetobacterium woodii]|uniref:Amino acid ABC transport system ATP-binding protein n=1 Tax=Acetobacterium woodii (strain ATCC 29683 / DSM 1030 / JCM 2381 / KCTC 1655 / WB1) TaxID=931626 RepID=H6LJ13_ACEWD|nr:amino acid ABC transporter ATP-binding protein [Acetobacterium woodii]AFA47376.1 amino acid ABC transport system ATP-binding protein [Acetobacterium woodii DSM 1030]